VTLVHVGDSRAYRYRDGKLGQLTTDHTLLGEMQAIGVAQVPGDAGPLAKGLTSYIGISSELLRVDVQQLGLRDGDIIVLCSDGVHGQIPPEDLVGFFESTHHAHELAELLVAEADRRGGRDNATAVVVQV
jgi:protein phosphatase